MSVLQRVTGWLSGRSSNNAQSAYGGYKPHGYYGSSQAEDAYGSMNRDRSLDMPEESYPRDAGYTADRFDSEGADPYNGRVPYRSRQDIRAEQEEAQQRMQQQDMRHRRTDMQQSYPQPPPPYQRTENVLDFPGQQVTPTHVEYVILLRSRNECTKVIEYIKTNASVFLNMEYIANESERQRCVDMLSGAAYTLGCQLHKISNRGTYLIASPYVRVMVDPAMRRFNATAETQPFLQHTGEYMPMQEQHASRPQFSHTPPFSGRMNEHEEQATAPYPQQQATAPYPQQRDAAPYAQRQSGYNAFQRQRPSFQSQQQAQPPGSTYGWQVEARPPSSYQASY